MIRQWKFTSVYYIKIFLNIRHTGGARYYTFNIMAFFLAPLKGEECYPTSDTNENFAELIFLCNSSASCNNKHQNSLCYKIFIHCLKNMENWRKVGITGDREREKLARCAQKSAQDELFAVQALLLHINAMHLQNEYCAHCLCPISSYNPGHVIPVIAVKEVLTFLEGSSA